jgi:hypothetical protein
MNAIQELGEVVKTEDKGERVVAFAGWISRWLEQGFIENTFPLDEAQAAGQGAPAARAESDLGALEALLGHMLRARPWRDLVDLEDFGVEVIRREDGSHFAAYRSRMKITVLLAQPHADEAPPAGLVRS